MTEEHRIAPPPELVQQWLGNYFGCVVNGELSDSEKYLATQAAQWGADQELEACINAILVHPGFESPELFIEVLRAARRPKPPSLRTALQRLVEEVLDANQYKPPGVLRAVEDARRAIESLPS